MNHAKTIFVAGASAERDEVSTAIELLRAAGWTVVLDWPKRQCEELERYGTFQKMPVEAKRELVRDLKNAIRSASFFWWMVPRQKSVGAGYEAGFFSGLHFAEPHGFMVVSGDPEPNSDLYAYDANKVASFNDHLAALNYLCGMN